MKRTSTAVWRGDGPSGTGSLTTQSGVLADQPYSFQTRFVSEDGTAGTNPEELLAAAHAGCFAMATAFALTRAGHPATQLTVTAAVDLSKDDSGFVIRGIALDLQATVDGIDDAAFQELAAAAKAGCPLSRALASTPITLSARRTA
ncbi:MAG: OsmC family peroxiredoxin [Alphaproteobacteria bacterium]|nr:OsmC family peroxiredoxin [Alphaproteobacteria bacterium]